MKKIVGLINTDLSALERLDINLPHIPIRRPNSEYPVDLPAGEVFAQLYHLRLELNVVFHIYMPRELAGRRCGTYSYRYHYLTPDELVAFITSIYASNRAKSHDRHRKKQSRELLGPDYYLLETADLRSLAYHEEGFHYCAHTA